METNQPLNAKVVGITGANGTLGQALIAELSLQGAKIIAFTTNKTAIFAPEITIVYWQIGSESEIRSYLEMLDILIINHGINVYDNRTILGIDRSYQVNTFSAIRLTEMFLNTVSTSAHPATKELWINTSEAEVNPAFSPLYELSKRTLGDLITLLRLDAPCRIRKLVLGPFKSQLNPAGVMSPKSIAWGIIALANKDFKDIIITINPITYLLFPLKEFAQSLYFRLLTTKHS